MKKIDFSFFKKSKYYVLSISNFNEVYYYKLVTVTYENEELKLIDLKKTDSLESCMDLLSKNYSIILHLEGDKILDKEVDNQPNHENELIFNGNLEDFYFYKIFQKKTILTSIVRAKILDNIVNKFRDNNLFIIHAVFGPYVLSNVLDFFKVNQQLQSEFYCVEKIEDNSIIVKKNNQNNQNHQNITYKILDDSFNSEEINLLAAFLDFKQVKEIAYADIKGIEQNKSEYKFKKGLSLAVPTFLISIIILLFVSHFLQKKYENQLVTKNMQFTEAQKVYAVYQNLNSEKKLKENVLQESGIINNNYISQYVADIGNSLKKEIRINQIKVFPPERKIEKEKQIKINNNLIYIEGTSFRDISFNQWITELKKINWIKKINILEYVEEYESNKKFKISIAI